MFSFCGCCGCGSDSRPPSPVLEPSHHEPPPQQNPDPVLGGGVEMQIPNRPLTALEQQTADALENPLEQGQDSNTSESCCEALRTCCGSILQRLMCCGQNNAVESVTPIWTISSMPSAFPTGYPNHTNSGFEGDGCHSSPPLQASTHPSLQASTHPSPQASTHSSPQVKQETFI